jgi:ComEC/Rec2-related protein
MNADLETKGPDRNPRRYLLAAAVAFGSGIAATRFLDLPAGGALAAAAGIAALTVAASLARRRAALVAGTLALTALAGALNFAVRSGQRPADDLGSLLDLSADRPALALVTGRVEDLAPVPLPGGRSYLRGLLAVESVGPPERSVPASGRMRLTLEGEASALPRGVGPGARVRAPLLIRAPEPPRSPGAMDFPAYAATRGVWTVGAGRAALCQPLDGGGPSLASGLVLLRERLAGIVREEMPPREGALLNTLLIGWRGEMDPEDELAFTRTGTGHLLAVSGIHVMLLVGAVWWVLRMFRASPRWSAVALVLFAVGYAELAGGRAPVMRAATMACIFLGGMVIARSADGLNSLAAAFLAILALWPRELFSAGFQMSFAAVAFIMAATPALEEAWRKWRGVRPEDLAVEKREQLRGRAGRWLRLSLFTSIAATLGTMPLIVSCFGLVSTWAVLINLVAIPIAGLALALGLVFLTVGLIIPPLVKLPAALVWGVLWLLETVVAVAERLPQCAIVTDAPPAWALLGFYVLALALLLAGRRLGPWRVPAMVAVLALSVAVSLSGWILRQPPPPGTRVTVLAVRRGAAAVVEDASGRKACTWAGGGRELVDLLRSERLGGLDLVTVGADRDNFASGAGMLFRSGRAQKLAVLDGNVATAQILELLRSAQGAERLAAGWRCRLGGLDLRAVGTDSPASENSPRPRPLMILARPEPAEGGAVLFADLSNSYAVRAALAEAAAGRLRADVVAVPYASQPAWKSVELLRASGARVAVLGLTAFEASEPAGRELVRMCHRAGVLPLVTADLGSLRCTITEGRVEIEHYADGCWRRLGRVGARMMGRPAVVKERL